MIYCKWLTIHCLHPTPGGLAVRRGGRGREGLGLELELSCVLQSIPCSRLSVSRDLFPPGDPVVFLFARSLFGVFP